MTSDNPYGYNGRLTRDVLREIAQAWPIEGREFSPLVLNKGQFAVMVVQTINEQAPRREDKKRAYDVLEKAGYVREGEVRAELVWQDLLAAYALELRPDGQYAEQKWFDFDSNWKYRERAILAFGEDGLLKPMGYTPDHQGSPYGYYGRLTPEVLKTIADLWPFGGKLGDYDAENIRGEYFGSLFERLERPENRAGRESRQQFYFHAHQVLAAAGYVREGKVAAAQLWRDLEKARLTSRAPNAKPGDSYLWGDFHEQFKDPEKYIRTDAEGVCMPMPTDFECGAFRPQWRLLKNAGPT